MESISEETDALEDRATSAFVVLNPRSGRCEAGVAFKALETHLEGAGIACRVYEPADGEWPGQRVGEALESGCDLVVAAGGDGTVSAVVNALSGSDTPLGIVPLGTANVLAGELEIPIDLDGACRLLAGEHTLARIDAMELGGKRYVTQVGVGLDAAMIRDTPTEKKRRFGRAAYVFTAVARLFGFQPRRFTLTVDGVVTRPRAIQVVVANCGTLGHRPFRWGPDIRPDDGRLDVCVIRAHTLFDLAAMGCLFIVGRHRRARNVSYLKVTREVTVATSTPMPVQADGELVGETPAVVRIVPGAIGVVVPAGSRKSRGAGF